MSDKLFPIRTRIADLTKVLRWHCGIALPDDDAGREYLALMIDHLGHLPDGSHRASKFAEVWAPWCTTDDLRKLVEASKRTPRWWKADELGRELNLSQLHRQELGVSTIAPYDISSNELLALRRRRKADRERERRLQRRAAQGRAPVATGELSSRGRAVLEALRIEPRWFHTSELAAMARLQFKDGRGRIVAAASMGKLLARTLDELVTAGLVSVRFAKTKTGLPVRLVRANNVPGERYDTAICHGDTVTTQ